MSEFWGSFMNSGQDDETVSASLHEERGSKRRRTDAIETSTANEMMMAEQEIPPMQLHQQISATNSDYSGTHQIMFSNNVLVTESTEINNQANHPSSTNNQQNYVPPPHHQSNYHLATNYQLGTSQPNFPLPANNQPNYPLPTNNQPNYPLTSSNQQFYPPRNQPSDSQISATELAGPEYAHLYSGMVNWASHQISFEMYVPHPYHPGTAPIFIYYEAPLPLFLKLPKESTHWRYSLECFQDGDKQGFQIVQENYNITPVILDSNNLFSSKFKIRQIGPMKRNKKKITLCLKVEGQEVSLQLFKCAIKKYGQQSKTKRKAGEFGTTSIGGMQQQQNALISTTNVGQSVPSMPLSHAVITQSSSSQQSSALSATPSSKNAGLACSTVKNIVSMKFKTMSIDLPEKLLTGFLVKAFKSEGTRPQDDDVLSQKDFQAFLQWLYKAEELIRKYKECWQNGALCGFIPRKKTERWLQTLPSGSFLFRLAALEGNIAISYIQNGRCQHIAVDRDQIADELILSTPSLTSCVMPFAGINDQPITKRKEELFVGEIKKFRDITIENGYIKFLPSTPENTTNIQSIPSFHWD